MIDPRRREGTADLLKGAALVLMVQVHIMELFARPDVQSSVAGRASLLLGGPPVAPVFLAVMGYFAARSVKTAGSLAFRGLMLLGLGFLLNVGLNCHLLLKTYFGTLEISPWEYVFGIDILFSAGLGLILVGLLFRPLFGSQILPWLLTALAVVVLTPVANEALTVQDARRWLYAYVAGRYWWSYFPLFPWLAYPLLGVCVRLWKEQSAPDEPKQPPGASSWKTRLLRWGPLGLALAITVPQAAAITHGLVEYYHHDGRFFLWLCVFLALWASAFGFVEQHWGNRWLLRWLKWMGLHVTLLYVLHWLIIGNTATAIYKTQSLASCGLWTVLVLVATNVLAYAWVAVFGRCCP